MFIKYTKPTYLENKTLALSINKTNHSLYISSYNKGKDSFLAQVIFKNRCEITEIKR